jgi:hypothetical protein
MVCAELKRAIACANFFCFKSLSPACNMLFVLSLTFCSALKITSCCWAFAAASFSFITAASAFPFSI